MTGTLEIVPGLTLDEDLFGAAVDGLTAHVPQLAPPTWEQFTAPSGWWLIPEADGTLSKAEYTLTAGPDLTVRVNVWFTADLRGMPHNHPWRSFTSHILRGGYTEARHRLDQAGHVVDELDVQHVAGTANTVDHDLFHEVTAVHQPGGTLTLMVCGPGKRGDWGYLDDSGRYLHNSVQPVEDFGRLLAALNHHQQH